MADTTIEWSQKVWNPVRGCDVYSDECKRCYAMRQAHRFSGPGGKYEGLTKLTKAGPVWTGEVRVQPDQLDAPLHWKAPRLIFVNSMSDLFYGDAADARRAAQRKTPFKPVPAEFVQQCYEVMESCPQHTFQILTKRPDRMFEVLSQLGLPPLANVLTGCSVGHQDAAEWRRPAMHLVADLGWRTWVSYEPALGMVDWDGWEWIDWLVAGSESGYGARAADAMWFDVARDWCERNNVAFFMKQILVGRRKLPFDAFPINLQVREYPK